METTDYVTMVSSDGFSFVIRRSAAYGSKTLQNMLDGGFQEAKTNTIHFDNITGETLEVVAQYLYHNEKYLGAKDVPDMDMPLEILLDVLLAADYLDI